MKKRTGKCCVLTLLAVSLVSGFFGCSKGGTAARSGMKIAVLPKMVGENYWDAVQTGCEEAIVELKNNGIAVEMIYDGPPQDQATNQRQAELLEGWIAQGVDVIVSASVDSAALTPTMKKAKDAGITVVMFDSGVAQDAMDLFIVQVVPEGMGRAVLGAAADQLRAKGYGPDRPANLAMMGQTKTDENINSWINAVRSLIATPEYNWIRLRDENTDIYYPGADETQVAQAASTLLSRMGPAPNQIQCALGMTSMTAPALGAAYESAAQKPDKNSIVLTGVATPNALNSYIMNPDNPVETGILWNCMDLGYLSVMTGYQLKTGGIKPDSPAVVTPRMGTREINNRVIIFSDPMVFNKDTVNNFNY